MQTVKIGHGNRVEWHDINDVKMIHESAGSRLAHKIGIGGENVPTVVYFEFVHLHRHVDIHQFTFLHLYIFIQALYPQSTLVSWVFLVYASE